MQSKATNVEQYLAELPADRRKAIQGVREAILQHLPPGYAEGMQYGMIGYFVPHSRYPAGYHCDPRQPLPFGGLASQKNHMAVYLMCLYGNSAEEAAFRAGWAKTGKKLDMGKCCIRFKRLEDLSLEVLGKTIASMPVDKYVARYESALGSRANKGSSKQKSTKASSPKKTVKGPAAQSSAPKKSSASTTKAKRATKKTTAAKTSRPKSSKPKSK